MNYQQKHKLMRIFVQGLDSNLGKDIENSWKDNRQKVELCIKYVLTGCLLLVKFSMII